MNDINYSLADENGENDKNGDNFNELCGEKEEIDFNLSEECLEEEQQSEDPADNVNQQQRYWPRKELTRNRNVHEINSLLDESSYKGVVYMNKDGVLEELWIYKEIVPALIMSH